MATTEEDDIPFDQKERGVDPIANPSEEDYNQRKRLQEIWDERKNVRDWRREIAHSIGQSISQEDANRHYHEELSSLIEIIHPLLIDVYADEGGAELWSERELGSQTIQPPDELADVADPQQRVFRGLKSIVSTPTTQEIRFNSTIQHHHKADQEVVETVDVTVPWNVLRTAWMELVGFMSKTGLEASKDDDYREDGFLDL